LSPLRLPIPPLGLRGREGRHPSDSASGSQRRDRCNLLPGWRILTLQVTRLTEIRVAEGVLAGARAGDPAAQAQIYALLAPGLFALILRIVGIRAVAEDVFQDTMIMVFEQLNQYRQEAPLGAWARQIALSRSLMWLRSPWHRARLSFGSHADAEVLLGPATLSLPGPDAAAFDMDRALASLNPTARAVVWLYEVEGWSHEEIARNFGRTVSFSKSQLARAHLKLRAWFEPEASQTCAPT
jgi:DNA-directed RNA polymerase specialized sigma24 family protein